MTLTMEVCKIDYLVSFHLLLRILDQCAQESGTTSTLHPVDMGHIYVSPMWARYKVFAGYNLSIVVK